MNPTEAIKANDMYDKLDEFRQLLDAGLTALDTKELKKGEFDGHWEDWQGPVKYILER